MPNLDKNLALGHKVTGNARSAYPTLNLNYLENMSYIFGMGSTLKLICISEEKISINRFWFEQQLPIEQQQEILRNANLPLDILRLNIHPSQ